MTAEAPDLFQGLGARIVFDQPADFLKIRETLTRIGVPALKTGTLYQSCHILHKRGHYAIMHFKELFILDGKPGTFSLDDKARRNAIVLKLVSWKLARLADPAERLDPVAPGSSIKVIPHREKGNWNLVPKYTIGSHEGPRARLNHASE